MSAQQQARPDPDLRDRGGLAQPLLIVEGLQKYFRVKTQDGKPASVKAVDDVSFSVFKGRRLYFPRLHTAANGWINWQWSAVEIERFCNAFDEPYPGAGTFCKDVEVRLRDVSLAQGESVSCHPFSAGLIVRIHREQWWVMARDA